MLCVNVARMFFMAPMGVASCKVRFWTAHVPPALSSVFVQFLTLNGLLTVCGRFLLLPSLQHHPSALNQKG